jgi:hypothetical protein
LRVRISRTTAPSIRRKTIGDWSTLQLKPFTASLGVFPLLSDPLLASCRPFLVLCFGSWPVPVPQEPASWELRLASLQAQVASAQVAAVA